MSVQAGKNVLVELFGWVGKELWLILHSDQLKPYVTISASSVFYDNIYMPWLIGQFSLLNIELTTFLSKAKNEKERYNRKIQRNLSDCLTVHIRQDGRNYM